MHRKHPKIDPKLKRWSRPLKPVELEKLERQIVETGRATDPLIVWKGRYVIVDGHNRLAICKKHNLPYVIEERDFANHAAAKLFMGERQLGRRNAEEWDRIKLAKALLPLYAEAAKRRMRAGKKIDPRRNSAEGADALLEGKGSTMEKLAKLTGLKKDRMREGLTALRRGSKKVLKAIDEGKLTPHAAWVRTEIESYLTNVTEKKIKMAENMAMRGGDDGGGEYEPGQLNKIVNGDVLAVLRRVPDNSFSLCFTSPPYITYQVGEDGQLKKDDKGEPIETPFDQWLAWMREVLVELYRVLRKGGRCAINLDAIRNRQDDSEYFRNIHYHISQIAQEAGFKFFQAYVWYKKAMVGKKTARGTKRSCKKPVTKREHEEIFVFSKETFELEPLPQSVEKINGKLRPMTDVGDDWVTYTTSVWEIPQVTSNRYGHPFPFPVALADAVLRSYSYVGCPVIDPFSGIGTTAVAAVKAGRPYLGIEVEAKWCEAARERIDEAVQEMASQKGGKRGKPKRR